MSLLVLQCQAFQCRGSMWLYPVIFAIGTLRMSRSREVPRASAVEQGHIKGPNALSTTFFGREPGSEHDRVSPKAMPLQFRHSRGGGCVQTSPGQELAPTPESSFPRNRPYQHSWGNYV